MYCTVLYCTVVVIFYLAHFIRECVYTDHFNYLTVPSIAHSLVAIGHVYALLLYQYEYSSLSNLCMFRLWISPANNAAQVLLI